MNLESATIHLQRYLQDAFPEFKGSIIWNSIEGKRNTKIALLSMPPYESVIAIFNPLHGVRVADTVALCKKGIWEEV